MFFDEAFRKMLDNGAIVRSEPLDDPCRTKRFLRIVRRVESQGDEVLGDSLVLQEYNAFENRWERARCIERIITSQLEEVGSEELNEFKDKVTERFNLHEKSHGIDPRSTTPP